MPRQRIPLRSQKATNEIMYPKPVSREHDQLAQNQRSSGSSGFERQRLSNFGRGSCPRSSKDEDGVVRTDARSSPPAVKCAGCRGRCFGCQPETPAKQAVSLPQPRSEATQCGPANEAHQLPDQCGKFDVPIISSHQAVGLKKSRASGSTAIAHAIRWIVRAANLALGSRIGLTNTARPIL